MKYASYYISSNGQPQNGYEEHTSKRAAIAAAQAKKANLIERGGGRAVAENCGSLSRGRLHQSETIYEWYEHHGGGYCTVR